jgi:hypothetical protein
MPETGRLSRREASTCGYVVGLVSSYETPRTSLSAGPDMHPSTNCCPSMQSVERFGDGMRDANDIS